MKVCFTKSSGPTGKRRAEPLSRKQTGMKPFIKLFRRHWKGLGLGTLLGLATVCAGIGLLGLAGWFIAAAAFAGLNTLSAQLFNLLRITPAAHRRLPGLRDPRAAPGGPRLPPADGRREAQDPVDERPAGLRPHPAAARRRMARPGNRRVAPGLPGYHRRVGRRGRVRLKALPC